MSYMMWFYSTTLLQTNDLGGFHFKIENPEKCKEMDGQKPYNIRLLFPSRGWDQ